MSWRESLAPQAMSRVAILAPVADLRSALVRVADAGTVELDWLDNTTGAASSHAARMLQSLQSPGDTPRLASEQPDVDALAAAGRADLLAGEAELAAYSENAVVRDQVAGLVGWTPSDQLPQLSRRLADIGAAAVQLPSPTGIDPPSASAPGAASRTFGPVVTTYTTVPYADVDPTVLAGLAYVVMFGAMFGDAGHGLLLVLAGLAIRRGLSWPRPVAKLRPHWLFITGAGVSAAFFGLGYGEFFGPTGVVPVWWISPMQRPVPLLLGGVALGAVLLAGAYALGTINRLREGGWGWALYAPSGFAGCLLFTAAGLGVAAVLTHSKPLALAAGLLAVVAVGLAFVGFWALAGRGPTGLVQAVVEVFDMVVRLLSNVVSFVRLAAFGLMHAVLGFIVWDATTGVRSVGPVGVGWVAAVVVFVIGNALAFALEALIAGVQALRLEYYELFSRVFQLQGRPFRPWHVPADIPEKER
jgi:V/A-type H+/Na+-transporting ATPase subunit I